jgi:hypothetical protein
MTVQNGVLESWSARGTGNGIESWSDELATDETRIKHGCRKNGLIRKAGKKERPTTDVEKTLNRRERRSGACGGGKRRFRKGVFTGLSGREVARRTGFYHLATGSCGVTTGFYRLGPDNSMQVVDFPHVAVVRVFWEVQEIENPQPDMHNGVKSQDRSQKRGNKTTGTGIITGPWAGVRRGESDGTMKENT